MSETGVKKKILVVDDEQGVLDFYQALLKDHGYDVDTAADGITAFRMVNRGDYDLVHMDLRMPGSPDWDGIGAIVSIGLVEKHPTPIIVVSGYLDEDTIKELDGESNVACWFEKPMDPERYLKAIKDALKE